MPLAPDLDQRLKRLTEAFLEENAKTNLSAFRTPELCWTGNVLDALALIDAPVPPFPRLSGLRIVDVGTGGGFPLLPLAMSVPDAQFTGIDSMQKKVHAIEHIAKKMHMSNIDFICGRAEELGRDPQLRESFDVVTARAVASINVLLEYTAPLVKTGGSIILWKSMTIDQELQESLLARAELSCHLTATFPYDLDKSAAPDAAEAPLPQGYGGQPSRSESWGKRQLLLFIKTAALSKKYPREVGVPKKDPLR